MTTPEEALASMYSTYLLRTRPGARDKITLFNKSRWLGGMEVLLQLLGAIDSGLPIDYKKKTVKILYINWVIEERYEEYIIRKACEYLGKSK